MKKTLLLLILLLPCLLNARSVVPERVITPSLDLFSELNKELSSGDYEVRVTTYSKTGDFIRNGRKIILSKKNYQSFKNLSLPVLEMIPHYRTKKPRAGTAFSIGENLVVTNQHVLDPDQKNVTDCDDFEVRGHDDSKYTCKKIHLCSIEHDVCLIEMNPLTKVKRSCFFCRGTKYDASLAVGPKLRFKANYSPLLPSKEILTAIGNPLGFGIHFSQGIGMKFVNHHDIHFYAPMTTGNSGGPLLNNEGLVVGIVKRQTQLHIGDDPSRVYNIAESSESFIRLVREALRDDPETLEKFNRSVVE